jgi:membrane protease YdiL (CAAX protease family)
MIQYAWARMVTANGAYDVVRVVRLMTLQCAVMVGMAFAISAAFGPKPLLQAAAGGRPILVQLAWGLAIGAGLSALTFVAVFFLPVFSGLKRFLIGILSGIDLDGLNPFWISLSAGTGEEMLFRGALQPLLGLWWTSLIFALAHLRPGIFRSSPRNATLFFVSVFAVSVLAGTVCLQFGLIAAIVMHAAWDTVATLAVRHGSRAG